jgi:type II secretory pathway pseudopilin PulG
MSRRHVDRSANVVPGTPGRPGARAVIPTEARDLAVAVTQHSALSTQHSVVGPQPRPLAARYSPLAASRSAFTMAEVLFAVIVLGIGLILLAAAFPVGIVQTEKTQDLTTANFVAKMAYDQLTKVPASGVFPNNAWGASALAAAAEAGEPVANYAPNLAVSPPTPGKPMVAGFLDGMQTVVPSTNAPIPDLRLKLVYPFSLYSDAAAAQDNPTRAEDCPQASGVVSNAYTPSQIGRAAYAAVGQPIPYALVWGFRSEGAAPNLAWHENVSWVYPGDRRYYWYAFYRQMYDAPFYHPGVFTGTPGQLSLRDQFQADHITRRTYRTLIVVCRTPDPGLAVRPPQQIYAAHNAGNAAAVPFTDLNGRIVAGPENKLSGAVGASYSDQWTRSGLAPVRVPATAAEDSNNILAVNGAWITDAQGIYLARSITSGFLKRGGIVLDCWGNIYQVVDMTANAIRLDRALSTLPAGYGYGDVRDCLPLWFNPNAIAVFPTIMTKQADLP